MYKIRYIKVGYDNTDAFVLLLLFPQSLKCPVQILIEPLASSRVAIVINATLAKHSEIAPSLLTAHVLSGCEIVPMLFNIS